MGSTAQKILIVDDEFSIVETLAEILEWEGFAVVTASEGLSGLAAIEREKPDLVLLDFMMPGMDGLTMLAKLRERADGALPVIFMTAATSKIEPADRRWDALVPKPFSADHLLDTIRRLLAASKP